jgi:uncharacterized protein (TIGR03083 family)
VDLLAEIADERRQIADLFGELSDDQQATPSLCRGWATKDVAGHLVSVFGFTPASILLGLLRRGGNLNRLSFDLGRQTAASHTIDELASVIRANAENPIKPPGLSHKAPLTDVIMHSLDVRRPLGLTRHVPEPRLKVVLDYTAGTALPGFGGKRRIRGLRLEATDLDWSRGDGPLVRGPAVALLMAMGGRSAFCDDLEGEGAPTLRSRLP